MSNVTATKMSADGKATPTLKLVDSDEDSVASRPKADDTVASTAVLKAAETLLPDEDDANSKIDDTGVDSSGGLKAPKTLLVRLSSLGVAYLDDFSLLRVFRREFRSRTAYFRSPEGGGLMLDEAIEKATREMDSQNGDEVMVRLLTTDPETIDFKDLLDLWSHSKEDAEFIWTQMKLESRRELMSGHLAATVFEPVEWMRSAAKRAMFLGVRDAFIDEYEPQGGVEIALVDSMAQAYFLQLHWTEEAVKRTRTEPHRPSEQFLEWLQFKYEHETGWDKTFDPGNWERLRVSEFECQEQALKLADHFSRLFLRIVKQLDNHRLAKAKLKRLALPSGTKSVIESELESIKRYVDRLHQAKTKVREDLVDGTKNEAINH